jgi:hypothetical protein
MYAGTSFCSRSSMRLTKAVCFLLREEAGLLLRPVVGKELVMGSIGIVVGKTGRVFARR